MITIRSQFVFGAAVISGQDYFFTYSQVFYTCSAEFGASGQTEFIAIHLHAVFVQAKSGQSAVG